MAAPLRQGPALSKVLRLVSTSSPRLPLRPSQPLRASPLALSTSRTRLFSTIPILRQQAAQAYDQHHGNNARQPHLTKFQELADHGLVSPKVISTVVDGMGIHTMTEVQRMTINECLDGADVIAQAKTGTGKTIAFLMPIIQRILRDPSLETRTRSRARADDIRALIISPTRELAEQIAAEAKKIVRGTAVKVQTAVGGSQKSYHLRLMQQEGCHILVGTPGRVNDILSDGYSGVSLDNIETFVLDEADRLLDIGFAPAIEEIQSYMPRREERARQTLMFSATVPTGVVALVRRILRPDFKFIRTVNPDEAPTHENIPQTVTYIRGLENQMPALVEIAKGAISAHRSDPTNNMPFKAIVYMNSTAQVALAEEILSGMRDPSDGGGRFARGPLAPCDIIAMHSKLTQSQRTHNSQRFRNAESALLLSSDVTARGMDFPNVSHVIQINLPSSAEDYVHRLGRTGRAGKAGQGTLLLQDDDRLAFRRMLGGREFNIKEDDSIQTAKVDMSETAQLPQAVANILKLVESGVRNTPDGVKSAAFVSMLGPLTAGGRPKQAVVDRLVDLSKYGWGMQTPPPVSPTLVAKLGLSGTRGLNLQERRSGGFGERGGFGDRRGGFGGSRGGRDSFNQRDPFGRGDSFGDRGSSESGGSFGRDSGRSGQSFGRSFDRDGGRSGGGFGNASRGRF